MRSGGFEGAETASLRFLVATAMVGILLGCSPGSDANPDERETGAHEPAPEFTLARLDGGEPVELASLRGKTVVLDFWATWCAPCEFQVPELNRFHDAHRGDSDVAVFGISIDSEGPEVVQAWVTEKAVRYPILLGAEDLARRYGAMGFPTLFVIGPDGTVQEQHIGVTGSEELETALARQRSRDAS